MKTKAFFVVTKEMDKRIKLNVLFESLFGLFFFILFAFVLIPIFFNDYDNIQFLIIWSAILAISFICTIVFFLLTYNNLRKLKQLLNGNNCYSKKIKKFIEKRLKKIYIPFEGLVLSWQIWILIKKINK